MFREISAPYSGLSSEEDLHTFKIGRIQSAGVLSLLLGWYGIVLWSFCWVGDGHEIRYFYLLEQFEKQYYPNNTSKFFFDEIT